MKDQQLSTGIDQLFEDAMAESDRLYALASRLFAQAGFNDQKMAEAQAVAHEYAEAEARVHRIYRRVRR